MYVNAASSCLLETFSRTHLCLLHHISSKDSDRDSDDEDDEAADVAPDQLYDEEEDVTLEKEVAGLTGRERVGEVRLSCPCCFALLCTDCQRHAIYKTQWRAMFVTEKCIVDEGADQLVPNPAAAKESSSSGDKGGQFDDAPSEADETAEDSDAVKPVKCGSCAAQVGVLDSDEVYHFFGVIPSV